MNSVLSDKIGAYLNNLSIGPPSYDKSGKLNNMVAYPLFPSFLSKTPPKIITLGEAINNGLDLVDTGIIGRVQARNDHKAPILAIESDILLGNTQERSIQFSCILPPRDKTSIAVSCVEEGRPTIQDENFTDHGACPWPIRSFKNEQLARNGEPIQFWVWERIRKYLNDTKTESSTNSLYDSLKKQKKDLISLSPAYPIHEGQVGVVFSVGSSLYVESFSDPELFEDSYKKTLYSALTEALSHPSDQIVGPNAIYSLFDRINKVTKNTNILKSSRKHTGQTIAFGEPFLSGQALIADKELVHLSGHQRCLGKNKTFYKLKSELDSAQSRWETSPPAFLSEIRTTYRKRLSRYKVFKKKLNESSYLKKKIQKKSNIHSSQYSSYKSGWDVRPFSKTILELFIRIFYYDRD
ncbi:MAG: DUF6569 family protein [Candidatus Latescibacterota bacterium]|nr:DUF6569 family protein [Candidatus Latescibacterota bacterium]